MGSTAIATPETQRSIRGFTGQLATAVSVVIALSNGEPFGTTAGSVAVVSMNPPMLGVSFRIGSRMDEVLRKSELFTINVLGETDQRLAHRFSRPDRAIGWNAFAGIPLERRDPAPPCFSNSFAWAECAVMQTVELGDHRLYIGEVREIFRRDSIAPLVYFRGRYRALGPAVAPSSWHSANSDELMASW